MRRELERGLSWPKMSTFESRKALLGILGLPHILPELSGGYAALRGSLERSPEILGAQ